MPSLLCKSHVRRYALERTSAKARGFQRVAPSFYDRIDRELKRIIEREVQTHPSRGATLK